MDEDQKTDLIERLAFELYRIGAEAKRHGDRSMFWEEWPGVPLERAWEARAAAARVVELLELGATRVPGAAKQLAAKGMNPPMSCADEAKWVLSLGLVEATEARAGAFTLTVERKA